jgi:iron complex outermembrane receptor protein
MHDIRRIATTLLALCLPALHAAGATQANLADLSLEELANTQVTSVSRRPERLSDAAASVFVITAEAIRRSGATTLPEALRLAPNLQVARVNASEYAISARGFNNANGLANKLLVLIDGRTVYTPSFSGVFWDQQDVMLEDVERIEVISGPGATLWGANAVNGVINVISRASADSQGALVSAGGGNGERGAAFRYGGQLGENGHFRAYGKTIKLNNTKTASGTDVLDGWERHQIGFRSDWRLDGGQLTVQGDAYHGVSEPRGRVFGVIEIHPLDVSGANLLASWTQKLAGGSDLRVQTYYDHSERNDTLLYQPKVDIFDFEFQHGLSLDWPMKGQKLVWGGGYRRARDDIAPGVFFGFNPQSRSVAWKNLFVQDAIDLSSTVALTLGLKLEDNDFTGTEKLPSLRLSWNLSPDQLLWGAVSRAVRAPARLDRDIRLPPNPPYIIAGGPDFVSEVATVYELGYRTQPLPSLSYSATAFMHDWDHLRSGQPPPNAQVQNMIEGKTYGVEAWATWQVMPSWRVSGGLTTLQKDLRLKAGSTDPVGPSALGDDPDYQWQLRSAFNLPRRQQLDLAVRRVAALPDPGVPAYTALDVRYAWRVSDALELSVVAQDLLDAGHPEFNAEPGRSDIGRNVMLQMRWSL